jgi:hypothetical protein
MGSYERFYGTIYIKNDYKYRSDKKYHYLVIFLTSAIFNFYLQFENKVFFKKFSKF